MTDIIEAYCHTGDWVEETTFNAYSFVSKASIKTLAALLTAEWSNASDSIVEGAARLAETEGHLGVASVLSYYRANPDIGLGCSIDAEQAMRWLRHHRAADLVAAIRYASAS
jgi:hypothetical protein